MSKLYYDNVLLDYNDETSVRHNAFDIRDADVGSSSKSYDIEIPLTQLNRKTLKVPEQINSYIELTGIMKLYSGNTLLIQGFFRIFKINKTSISGIIEAIEWIDGLESLSIRDIGWVAEDKHLFSSANIRASWLGSAATLFRYPLIYFGKLWSEMTGTSAQVMPWDFVPSWNIYEIVKKMFSSIKYSLSDIPDEGTDILAITQTESAAGEPDYYHFGFIDRNPKNGRYVHLCRLGNSHLGNDGKIVLFWSTDGKTGWTLVSTVVDSAYDDRGAGGGYNSDGRLFLFWNNYDNTPTEHSRYNAVIYSDDDGLIWTSENQILVFGAGESGTVFGRIIELDDGTLMISGYWLIAGVYSLGYFKSVDSGVNWTRHDIKTTAGVYAYLEGSMVYLGYDQILCVCRKSLAGANTCNHQFYSKDKGATWTDQGDTTFETWGVTSGRERPPFIVLMDYLGKKIVVNYYVVTDRFKYRAVYALASEIYPLGVAAWKGFGSELLTGWTNDVTFPFDVWDAPLKDIVNAQETSTGYDYARSNLIFLTLGDKLTFGYTLTRISGAIPVLLFLDSTTTVLIAVNLSDGYNEIEIDITKTDNWRFWIYSGEVPVNFGLICSLKKNNSVTTLMNVYEYSPPSGYTRNGYQTVVHVVDKWQGIGQIYREASATVNKSDIFYYTTPLDNRVRVLTALGLTELIDNARNFFATGIGRNLYIMGQEPVNNSDFASGKAFESYVNEDADNIDTISHTAGDTLMIDFYHTLQFLHTVTDEGGYFLSTAYTIPVSGTYRFYTAFKIKCTHNIEVRFTGIDQNYDIIIYKNTPATILKQITQVGGIGLFNGTATYIVDTGYVYLVAGDTVAVQFTGDSTALNTGATMDASIWVNSGPTAYFKNYQDNRNLYKGLNYEISPVTFLPDITCIDLLKSLKSLFGLRFWIDQLRKKIHVFPTDQFITGNVIDWSNLIDFSKQPEYTFVVSNYKKNQLLKYKDDSNDKALQDYILINGFPFKKEIVLTSENVKDGEETRENTVFAPTIEHSWDVTTIAGNLPTIFDDFIFPAIYPDNRITEWEPRLFLWEGLYPKEFVYNTNFTDTPETLTQYPKARCLTITELYNRFYQKYWHYIDKSKLLTIYIVIDINKLNQFVTVLNNSEQEAFRATYKLTIDGSPAYFILNNLVTNGKIAKCEFIQKI